MTISDSNFKTFCLNDVPKESELLQAVRIHLQTNTLFEVQCSKLLSSIILCFTEGNIT